ncbi:redoxin domain-containing protein [Sulfurimonas sp.]|jgi:thiol-disulfide isomerase/thioredoxin|uniref:redoxin domain-containing protein n=1 Tax=Sulfurimonas sp. TaxID=2022749 RepID=UPI0025F9F974|nr:redoxin domain-containing protein [Sulfurimonas sp.]MBT5935325.1 redoxin domain-containing protein [Sulfurimonas sp.]
MKEKLKHYAKEISLFILVITIFANVISIYKSQNLNNDVLSLQIIKPVNKPILVHVWAVWCPICKAEADNIQRVSEYYAVITIAVNSGDDTSIEKYMKENNLDFKFINDINGKLAQELNVNAYPSTFIYDKDRNLVFSEVGYTSSIGLFLRMIWSSF